MRQLLIIIALIIIMAFTAIFVFRPAAPDVDNIAQNTSIGFADGDDSTQVTQDLIFPQSWQNHDTVVFEWFSHNTDIIGHDGTVTRPEKTTQVTVVLTVRVGVESRVRIFELTVKGTEGISTYLIEIYLQGIDDDVYELVEDIEEEAPVGEVIIITTERHGFVLNEMLSTSGEVVADGSLVIKVYYDRIVHTVILMDDTEVITTQHIRHEGLLDAVDVERDHHLLAGWIIAGTQDEWFDITQPITEDVMLETVWQFDYEFAYQGYYVGFEDWTGDNLETLIRARLNQGVTMQTYGDARDILQITDRDPDNADNLIVVFLGHSVPAVWDRGVTWNREHVWPQSLLGVSTNNDSRHIGADLHNLKPANPSENSRKGNKFLDNVTSTVAYAPPRDEIKGDLARMMFYMVMMYDHLELVNTIPTVYQYALLDVLLEWHLLDPVDDFERNRNEVIYHYQGNRNPFIDRPEWVEIIWGPIMINHNQSSTYHDERQAIAFFIIVTPAHEIGRRREQRHNM